MLCIGFNYTPICKLNAGESAVYSNKKCMSFPFNLDFCILQVDPLHAQKYIHLKLKKYISALHVFRKRT